MVERARGVEPFEVEVYDWLLHKSVKRPIPDHETLELADPGDAVEAEEVRIVARASPNYLFRWLSNCALIRAGEPRRLAPLAGSEVGAISTAPFSTEPVDPRYLYVLLHALGCRKLAFLLLGTRPIDGEEEALYDTVVADVPPPRGRYRPSFWERPVRVVFFDALPASDHLFGDLLEEERQRDPFARGTIRLYAELKVLERVAPLAALALARSRRPYAPYLPRRFGGKVYVEAGPLAEALREAAALREVAEKAGIPCKGFGEHPPPWDRLLGEAGKPAVRGLGPVRPPTPDEAAAENLMRELDEAVRAHLEERGRSVSGRPSASQLVLALANIQCFSDVSCVYVYASLKRA
jgi:hypothetical protein